jgi:hypothetical protein
MLAFNEERRKKVPRKGENMTQPTEASATPEAAAPSPAAQPTDSENGTAAPAPLAGLRGDEYVKALSSHPTSTLQVPLLPIERRGDWGRAKGQKIPVTSRQTDGATAHWLERDHTLSGVIVALERPGATRHEQISLSNVSAREAIEHLSDYLNQTRLRAQAQTGKKWTATQVYLIPAEDA